MSCHLVSDVPVGAFLSGGVDSSALVGLMAEVHDGPVRTVTLSIDDPPQVTEGDSGTVDLDFTVTLSATSAVPVRVDFATSNGTADAGTDFVGTNDALTIPALMLTGTIRVLVNGDTEDEFPSQDFYVNLSSPSDATIADGHAVVDRPGA